MADTEFVEFHFSSFWSYFLPWLIQEKFKWFALVMIF